MLTSEIPLISEINVVTRQVQIGIHHLSLEVVILRTRVIRLVEGVIQDQILLPVLLLALLLIQTTLPALTRNLDVNDTFQNQIVRAALLTKF